MSEQTREIVRPVSGVTYFAPCVTTETVTPLIFGEHHGFIVDAASQSVAVVYTSRERADAALADVSQWHPNMAARVAVRAVTYSHGRFTFAPSGDFDCCAHGTGHGVAGVAL